ncbi:MAG TPA: type II toxin-antitoxin system RelE/ParE family toxin [Xanthobacteraceae bacterium]|jgi:toxin ParE1/3/4|nr:type II toxin-antitoxin system RelE/ParE family toxin [Xanthobacteraceae bacterium]
MKVVYTAGARRDLDEIGEWLSDYYPTIAPAVERRIHNVIARIAQWPLSARRSAKYPGVRVVPIGRYPYKIFYRITADTIEVLHIQHSARQPWDEK